MAACNVGELLAANPCFYDLPVNMLNVVMTQLWCDITSGSQQAGGQWWNVDINKGFSDPDVANAPIVNPGS